MFILESVHVKKGSVQWSRANTWNYSFLHEEKTESYQLFCSSQRIWNKETYIFQTQCKKQPVSLILFYLSSLRRFAMIMPHFELWSPLCRCVGRLRKEVADSTFKWADEHRHLHIILNNTERSHHLMNMQTNTCPYTHPSAQKVNENNNTRCLQIADTLHDYVYIILDNSVGQFTKCGGRTSHPTLVLWDYCILQWFQRHKFLL